MQARLVKIVSTGAKANIKQNKSASGQTKKKAGNYFLAVLLSALSALAA